MTASRLARYGAVATAIVWALKALAIWEAGGLGKTSLEDAGWALGTPAILFTWAALGFAFASGGRSGCGSSRRHSRRPVT